MVVNVVRRAITLAIAFSALANATLHLMSKRAAVGNVIPVKTVSMQIANSNFKTLPFIHIKPVPAVAPPPSPENMKGSSFFDARDTPNLLVGIPYQGGEVMVEAQTVHLIYYGSWLLQSVRLINEFVQNLGGSDYYNIVGTYYDQQQRPVSTNLKLGKAITPKSFGVDNYYMGRTFDESAVIPQIVKDAISASALPLDATAIYVVLTSADVLPISGFCTIYCAWHWAFQSEQDPALSLKFAFVPSMYGCLGCARNRIRSPNDLESDTTVDPLAHEIVESVTDPTSQGWVDENYNENADICSTAYGHANSEKGYQWNVNIGKRKHMIQQNFVNVGVSTGYCSSGIKLKQQAAKWWLKQ